MSNCKYIKKNGEQCKAMSLKNDDYCFWHSQKIKEKRSKALKSGGKAKKNYSIDFDKWEYESTQSLISLLELLINKTIKGEIPTKVSNSVAYLTNILLSIIKERDLEQRLEVIEHVIQIKQENKKSS